MIIQGENFGQKMVNIANIIAQRTVVQKTKRQLKTAKPRFFDFVIRDNRLVCIWCQNRKRHEKPICRISSPEKGFTVEEWDHITKSLVTYEN